MTQKRYWKKKKPAAAASSRRRRSAPSRKLLTVVQVQNDRVYLSDGRFYRPEHGHQFAPGMRVPVPSGSVVKAF